MSAGDLVVLYLIAGAACAVAIYRRSAEGGARRWTSAALAVPLWPLWAPVALTAAGGRRPAYVPGAGPAAARIRAALQEGIAACEGTPLARLWSRDAGDRVLSEVGRVEARAAELTALLSRRDLDPDVANARLRALEAETAEPRLLATARLHLDNVNRLAGLLARDRSTLVELAGLVEALRTQLVLARYAGASAEGVSDIVSEVWARLEGLDEAMEAFPSPGTIPAPHAS